jgi:hypothetical protein
LGVLSLPPLFLVGFLLDTCILSLSGHNLYLNCFIFFRVWALSLRLFCARFAIFVLRIIGSSLIRFSVCTAVPSALCRRCICSLLEGGFAFCRSSVCVGVFLFMMCLMCAVVCYLQCLDDNLTERVTQKLKINQVLNGGKIQSMLELAFAFAGFVLPVLTLLVSVLKTTAW